MTGITTNKHFSMVTGNSGTMTRDEVRDYVYQLKMFLASKNSVYSHTDKMKIEAEISFFESVKKISTKIVGR